MLYNRTCIKCHKDYVTISSHAKRLCSDCKEKNKILKKQKAGRKKQDLSTTMKCAECKKEYSLNDRKGIFCSSNCERKFRNRQVIIQKRVLHKNGPLYNAINSASKELYRKECKFCNRKFLTKDIEMNFCNDICLHKYLDREKGPKDKHQVFINKCKVCGVKFEASYPDSKFCSRECQNINRKSKNLAMKRLGDERRDWIELFVEQMINKANSGGEVNLNGAYINYHHIAGFNNTVKTKIMERDYYECVLCKSKRSLHIHHIIPRQYGGTHDENNLVTLCARCHGVVETRDIKYAQSRCVENAILVLESKRTEIGKSENMVIYDYINKFLLAVLNEDIILNEEAKKMILDECSDIIDNIDKIYE